MANYTIPLVLTILNMTGHLDVFLERYQVGVQVNHYLNIMDEPLETNNTYFDISLELYEYIRAIASNNEQYCNISFAFIRYPPTDAGQIYCNSTWDSVTCWPTTAAGHLAEVSCPAVVHGVKYDSSQNATRMCFPNGSWQEKSNYTRCVPLTAHPDEGDNIHNFVTRVIYYVGFTTSLVALVIALWIFYYFRSLRCLRNTIHCHLILTFIIRNVLWIVMNYQLLTVNNNPDSNVWECVCKFTMTVYNYIQVTNFFWMLVEGLYLHTMIVWAYSAEKMKAWYYCILGWGFPVIFIVIWAVIKALFEDKRCWLPMDDTYYDYIYIVPILMVLVINMIFLLSIMYVMITKLRANSLQTRQYRKAVRATVILFPLLGITYVVFIAPPSNDPLAKNIFVYFNAVLQSTQGLLVAIFYCFMNGEVRQAIRQRIDRWNESRSISLRYTRASIVGNTNTENIGLDPRAALGGGDSGDGNGVGGGGGGRRSGRSDGENGRLSCTSNLTRSTRSSQDYTNSCRADDTHVTKPMLKDEPL